MLVNRVNEKICRYEKSQGHRGHRKVKYDTVTVVKL